MPPRRFPLSAPPVFDQQHYELLNRARGDVVRALLADLKGPLNLRTAIDVGCGLGYFSQLLKSLGFEVIAIDGRRQNLDEAQRRNPGIRFLQFDAENPAMPSLGKFDLVFCFGLLYHLENPMRVIRHLKEMTGNLFLVEGVIYPGDGPTMTLVEESPDEDQGLNHFAFYPTEACLLKMFYRAGFPHAYTFSTQPNHSDYRSQHRQPRIRTMLAASHTLVHSALLTSAPEPNSPTHPCALPGEHSASNATEKIRRFAKKPLEEKVRTIKRIVKGESGR